MGGSRTACIVTPASDQREPPRIHAALRWFGGFGEVRRTGRRLAMSGDPPAADSRGVDPRTVQILSELAQALNQLRGARSYTELDKAVNPDHGKGPRIL